MALTSPTLIALRQMAFGDLQGAPQFGNYSGSPQENSVPGGGGGAPPANLYPLPPWASNLPPDLQATLPPGTFGPSVPPPWSGAGGGGGAPPPGGGGHPPLSGFDRLRQSLDYRSPFVTMNDTPSDRPGGTVPVSGPGQPNVNYNDQPDSQRIADYFGAQLGTSSPLPGPVGDVSMPMYTAQVANPVGPRGIGYGEIDLPTAQIELWLARGDSERDIRQRLGLPV